jgi:oligogalacturonide lyase
MYLHADRYFYPINISSLQEGKSRMKRKTILSSGAMLACMLAAATASAQIGHRSPSEIKHVPDPITGTPLTFLTSAGSGDNTLYQTHQGWTADGKWIIFRSSDRAVGQGAQAFAVNEESGDIVQITEGPGNGFGSGAINVAQKSMKMYYTRNVNAAARGATTAPAGGEGRRGGRGGGGAPVVTGVYELDLGKLLPDAMAGTVKDKSNYERLCGQLPPGMTAGGGFGLDANEQVAYISVRGGDVGSKLPEGVKPAERFGPRNMGAGPSGIRAMDLKTGEVTFVADVPVQIGHLQANPFNPGEIIYCWETGGKAPTRAWVINADGTNNRPVFNERPTDWVTHETVIGKDEVAIAILGHRPIGSTADSDWGVAGTREYPGGVAVSNLRTKETRIFAQTPSGSGFWHVNGSYNGRFLTGDDFDRNIWLVDRKNGEILKLSTSHRTTAADHPHPIFNPPGTKILVQSAMIAPDERAHDLCIIPVPKTWLNRTYSDKAPE